MGRKHPTVVAVETIVTKILAAIGSTEPFQIKNTVRTETSGPYRELRVTSVALYEACRDEDKDNIFDLIRLVVPKVVGVYEKRHVRGNKAGRTNKAVLDGLLIKVEL